MLTLRKAAGGQQPVGRNGEELGKLHLQLGLSSLQACHRCLIKVPEDQHITSPRRSISSQRPHRVVCVCKRIFLPVRRLESPREFRKAAPESQPGIIRSVSLDVGSYTGGFTSSSCGLDEQSRAENHCIGDY